MGIQSPQESKQKSSQNTNTASTMKINFLRIQAKFDEWRNRSTINPSSSERATFLASRLNVRHFELNIYRFIQYYQF